MLLLLSLLCLLSQIQADAVSGAWWDLEEDLEAGEEVAVAGSTHEEAEYVAITSGTCEEAGMATIEHTAACKIAVERLAPGTWSKSTTSTSMYNGCFKSTKSGKSYLVTDKLSYKYLPSDPDSFFRTKTATKTRKRASGSYTYYCIKDESSVGGYRGLGYSRSTDAEEEDLELEEDLETAEELAVAGSTHEEVTYVAITSGTCEEAGLATIEHTDACKVAVERLAPGTWSKSTTSYSMYNGCFKSTKSGKSYFVTDKMSKKYLPSDPDSMFRYKQATKMRRRASGSYTYYCIKDESFEGELAVQGALAARIAPQEHNSSPVLLVNVLAAIGLAATVYGAFRHYVK